MPTYTNTNLATRNLIRILIADDDELVRLGLRLTLQGQPGLEVVGIASDGAQAVELSKQCLADVVILDYEMPRLNGLTAATQIRQLQPAARIILHTSHDGLETAAEQYPDIDAFCAKGASGPELIALIRELAQPNPPEAGSGPQRSQPV